MWTVGCDFSFTRSGLGLLLLDEGTLFPNDEEERGYHYEQLEDPDARTHDLKQYRDLERAGVHVGTEPPENPTVGQGWYNTTGKKFWYWSGDKWLPSRSGGR